MNEQTFYHLDMSEISISDAVRFIDFLRKHPNTSIEEKVEVWNRHAKKLSQHIFYTKN